MKHTVIRTAVMSVITVCLIFSLSGCRETAVTEPADFTADMEYMPLTSVMAETAEAEISMQIIPSVVNVSEEPEQAYSDADETNEEIGEPVYFESESPSEDETAVYTEEQSSVPLVETKTVEYTIDDVSKTVYMVSAVNVRSGPWTDFNKIGLFDSGIEVAVTGVCRETGWYRCSFNGTDGYFDADYTADTVTSAQPKAETVSETESMDNNDSGSAVAASPLSSPVQEETYVSGGFPLWNYSWHSCAYLGRMRIPSVGVNVGLCNTDAQWAIDTWDSAAMAYHWENHSTYEYSTIYCADHNYQGFSAIANCTIGCVMYIDGVDGNTYKYVCDRIDYNGYNTGYGLNDCNGNSVSYTGGLWCYTCHEDSMSYIYMVHFTAV